MAETKKRLYKRDTVERKLNELLRRVDEVNSGVGCTGEYLYHVKRLVVFGSYLDATKDRVHDLDIGYELELKPKYARYGYKELSNARLDTMPDRLYEACGGFYRSIWPSEEVLRYLKNKSVIYSFHPLNNADERKIILGSRHKEVYNIEAAGEKERLHRIFEEYKKRMSKIFD